MVVEIMRSGKGKNAQVTQCGLLLNWDSQKHPKSSLLVLFSWLSEQNNIVQNYANHSWPINQALDACKILGQESNIRGFLKLAIPVGSLKMVDLPEVSLLSNQKGS